MRKADPMFYVEIVKFPKDGQPEVVERRMGPFYKRQADRCEDGADINLNHETHFTRQVEA